MERWRPRRPCFGAQASSPAMLFFSRRREGALRALVLAGGDASAPLALHAHFAYLGFHADTALYQDEWSRE